MKSKKSTCFHLIVLFTALAIPLGLAGRTNHAKRPTHLRYKLIDIGTFGGPTSWFCNDLNLAGGACAIQNRRGTIVSGADTSDSNPNYQNPNPFFPPSTVPGDPFIQHAFRWQDDRLQDLGTLSGGYNSWAQAVSANGLIAGLSENGLTDPVFGVPEAHAVLWKDNGNNIVDLGTLEGGYESFASGVNSWGQVVGIAFNSISDPFWFFPIQSRAFLWQNGAMQDLGTLGTGTDAQAYWINDRGQVAGASFTNTTVNQVLTYCTAFQIETPTQDPFLWDRGKLIDLGTLGGSCGVPNALNNRGQVVGLSDDAGDVDYHAFLWPGKNHKMQDLGTLGGCCAIANWINDEGAIVGGSWTQNDQNFHAFLWKQGRMTDLGPPDACTEALGINSKNQVVGFSCGNTAAILWDQGQAIDLNTFNYSGSGLQQLDLAYNINDRGEIVGLGLPPGCGDPFACGHTFVLIPCDEHHGDRNCADDNSNNTIAAPQPARVFGGSPSRTQPLSIQHRVSRYRFPGLATDPRN
jgi:probable HAF family extracellular repeat protein